MIALFSSMNEKLNVLTSKVDLIDSRSSVVQEEIANPIFDGILPIESVQRFVEFEDLIKENNGAAFLV